MMAHEGHRTFFRLRRVDVHYTFGIDDSILLEFIKPDSKSLESSQPTTTAHRSPNTAIKIIPLIVFSCSVRFLFLKHSPTSPFLN